jgi:hypothetical protein
METGKFLQRAALVGVVAVPIAAVAAVVVPDESDDRVPCDGCGLLYAPGDLTPGELETQWCGACREAAFSAAIVWDAGPTSDLDPIVHEDDGEL